MCTWKLLRVDLKPSHYTHKELTMWGGRCANYLDLGSHSTMYMYIRSSLCRLSVQFSRSVVSNCLQPHGLQHTRLPCPSPSPGICSNSCPLSQWCHPTISPSAPLLLLSSVFPRIRVFSNESTPGISWNVIPIKQPPPSGSPMSGQPLFYFLFLWVWLL